MNKSDNHLTEFFGRNILIEQLLAAGLEVAVPVRDKVVDLIAYRDDGPALTAFPIQLKAATETGFLLDRKYAAPSGLILVYVWHAAKPARAVVFALTYRQALGVCEEMGYTQTESWARGNYAVTSPGERLRGLLERYRMTPEAWRRKLSPLGGAAA